MMIGHGACGGGEGEQVIDGRAHLKCALIAVAHDACDPLWIDDAGAHNAANLVFQFSHFWGFRAAVIIVIDRHGLARQGAGGDRHATFELIVIVRIQQVMLAVVLVVQDRLNLAQSALQPRTVGCPLLSRAIGITAPGQIGLRQISVGGPALLVNQGLQPRAIGPRLGAKDARARAVLGGLAVHPVCTQGLCLCLYIGGQWVYFCGFVQGCNRAGGGIHQIDQIGEGIAEES